MQFSKKIFFTILIICFFNSLCCAADSVTPAEYLKSIPKPSFKQGNTMLPLTRWGWRLSIPANIELAENWGYCLEFGSCTANAVRNLSNPRSFESKMVSLTVSNPEKYPLSILANRKLPGKVPSDTWTRNKEGKLLNAKAHSLDGTEWNPGMNTVYSPEAPDSVWKEAGKLNAEPMKLLRKKCPIAIVLNGGEYGLGVLGFAQNVWMKDPAIIKAKGRKSWFEYISEKKANEEMLIADAIKKAVPDRKLYIYYPTDGGFHRNQNYTWQLWYYGYQWMKPVSDLPDGYAYYKQFNSGWTGSEDLLTQALDAKGFEIKCGAPLSYNWLCGGWNQKDLGPEEFSDISLYTGFLKSYYNAGMLGGVAGYFSYPKGGFNIKFDKNAPPHWLRQIIALSRVHALFSHLEEYLRKGDLLPGPGKHRWSQDQPAYTFPVLDKHAKHSSGNYCHELNNSILSFFFPARYSENVRIIARKHREKPEWLITIWAANGKKQNVKTFIPDLGSLELLARPEGTVYIASIVHKKVHLKLIDKDGLMPSQSFK